MSKPAGTYQGDGYIVSRDGHSTAITLNVFQKTGAYSSANTSGRSLPMDTGEIRHNIHDANDPVEKNIRDIVEAIRADLDHCPLDPSGHIKTMQTLLAKEDWTKQDRQEWESALASEVGLRSEEIWGEYNAAGRRAGTLTSIINSGEFDCEIQSLVEGMIIQRVEDAELKGLDEGWKQPLDYVYTTGYANNTGAHAWIEGPVIRIESTTTTYAAMTREATQMEALDTETSTQATYNVEGGATKSYAGADAMLTLSTTLKSPEQYAPFFPNVGTFQATDRAGLLGKIKEFNDLNLLRSDQPFIEALADAHSDGTFSQNEQQNLRDLLADIDDKYDYKVPDSNKWDGRSDSDNFHLYFEGNDVYIGFRSGLDKAGLLETYTGLIGLSTDLNSEVKVPLDVEKEVEEYNDYVAYKEQQEEEKAAELLEDVQEFLKEPDALKNLPETVLQTVRDMFTSEEQEKIVGCLVVEDIQEQPGLPNSQEDTLLRSGP